MILRNCKTCNFFKFMKQNAHGNIYGVCNCPVPQYIDGSGEFYSKVLNIYRTGEVYSVDIDGYIGDCPAHSDNFKNALFFSQEEM